MLGRLGRETFALWPLRSDFYCSKACQTRNWKLHKRVCSTDPALRPFMPVEMAIERAVADATCYICLEGEGSGKSSKLMRGCACRGDSAGFVHIKCLTELAMSKEASGDKKAVFDAYLQAIFRGRSRPGDETTLLAVLPI